MMFDHIASYDPSHFCREEAYPKWQSPWSFSNDAEFNNIITCLLLYDTDKI